MAKRKRPSVRRVAKAKVVEQEIPPVAETAIAVADVPEKPEKKEEAPSGILCPECRFTMRVYRTKSLTGTVSRERICDRCGHREDTEEKIIK
jgi:hypothetical protein